MDRYRFEMDRLEPRQEKLDELYDMIEGGTEVKQAKWIGRKAAALILAAAVLTITAAAAAVPAVWEAMTKQLGTFAPYAQTIQGAVCRDKGIKVQVLSALADDLEARFYISVQDVEQDRLNEYLTLRGRAENGTKKNPEPESTGMISDTEFTGVGRFRLISYDPETKTALLSAEVNYGKYHRPTRAARISLRGMTTREGYMEAGASCAAVTGEVLKSLPMTDADKTIFGPSEIKQFNLTEAILPANRVVLAPEQNPMPLEGTEDMWISSMGFAEDGRFHIRLGFADEVLPKGVEEASSWFYCQLDSDGEDEDWKYVCYETLVPGGMDILFPLIYTDDLEAVKGSKAQIYGEYMRPGVDIEGSWNIDFQMEYHSSQVLDWTGELAGRQISRVTLSPLSVTMNSNDPGGFHRATLYAVMKDGSTIVAEHDGGSYSFNGSGGERISSAFNTWKFAEPVDLEEVVSLSLMDETIPVS